MRRVAAVVAVNQAGIDDFLRVLTTMADHLSTGKVRLIVRYDLQLEAGFRHAVVDNFLGNIRLYALT
ncbi:hypothetical protein D3C81_1933590 [compost metagenome]